MNEDVKGLENTLKSFLLLVFTAELLLYFGFILNQSKITLAKLFCTIWSRKFLFSNYTIKQGFISSILSIHGDPLLPWSAWQAWAWYDSFVKLAARERIASRFSGSNFNDCLKAASANGSCSFFAYWSMCRSECDICVSWIKITYITINGHKVDSDLGSTK